MRLLFSSYHNYLDPTSGAAVTTRAILLDLVRHGFEVQTNCGCFFDSPKYRFEQFIADCSSVDPNYHIEYRKAVVDGKERKNIFVRFIDNGIKSCAIFPENAFQYPALRNYVSFTDGQIFLKTHFDAIREFSPDVYLTYGGNWVSKYAAEGSKRFGVKNVFLLQNLEYKIGEIFKYFDSIIVPSEFCREAYHRRFGLNATVIPPLFDQAKILASDNCRKYLTFVTPTKEKGLNIFIRIANVLNTRRPDIPILVIEGRGSINALKTIPEARNLKLYMLGTVSEPRKIYEQTKIALMPSLCEETFGRVAVESLFNGIPVLCSDRGALPEVIADSRFVLDVPQRCVLEQAFIPGEEVVAEWTKTIMRLWDDNDFYQRVSEDCKRSVERRYAHDIVSNRMIEHLNMIVSER